MRPNEKSENFNLTTATETKTMGIDANSTVHIISLLTDLYSDPAMAVIREYSTNALDSHALAGQTRPIEVTVPTSYGVEQTFTVQDWGLGLSKEDITEIYSMYGSSTKRGTNDATGMLGLGCKSALTYAVSFTVDAVKDGWRTVASIAKGSNGVGEIQILLHEETTLHNGVTISIPVADHLRFRNKVSRFFWHWRGGVLVNGEVPANIDSDPDWTKIDPDVYTKPSSGFNKESMVVQGGVAYPMKTTKQRNSMIAYVPIGAVDFVPSREQLMYTDRTKEVIEDAEDFAEEATMRTFEKEAEECMNDWQRLKLYNRLSRLVSRETKKRFLDLERFRYFGEGYNTHAWQVSVNTDGTISRSRCEVFNMSWTQDSLNYKFIRNFDLKAFTNQHWERVKAAGFDAQRFIVFPESYSKRIGTASFPGIDWKKVPQLTRAKRQSNPSRKRSATQYMCYKGGRSHMESNIEGDACYKVTSDKRNAASNWFFQRFFRVYVNVEVVLISGSQEAKFNRLFPNVPTMDKWIDNRKNLVKARLTPDIIEGLCAAADVGRLSSTMRPHLDKIKNKEFKDLLVHEVSDSLRNEISFLGIDVSTTGYAHKPRPGDLYPLLGEILRGYSNQTSIEHAIIYINAIGKLNRSNKRRVA